jgi:hypothetical protein
MKELVSMKKLYDDGKERSKEFEVQIIKFREEVLNIKKDKNELNKKLKLVNETLESTQMKAKRLVEDNEGLEKMVQDQA